jgi:putative tricarboxylic transport membrane protein
MSERLKNQGAGLVLIVLAAAYSWQAIGYGIGLERGIPRPGAYPILLGVLLLMLGVLLVLKPGVRLESVPESDEEGPVGDVRPAANMLILLVLYVAVMAFFGFLIATPLFVFAVLWWIYNQKVLTSTLYALGITAGTFLLFRVLLDSGLPPGSIWS